MEWIERIKQSPVYIEVMKDSHGGIMYNVANQNKYKAKTILSRWNEKMTAADRECAGGIMQGAMEFLQGN